MLLKTEKPKILNFIEKYKRIRTEVDSIEEKILRLVDEKDKVLKELKETRDEEISFTEGLTKKYGKGRIEPTTLEWLKEEK